MDWDFLLGLFFLATLVACCWLLLRKNWALSLGILSRLVKILERPAGQQFEPSGLQTPVGPQGLDQGYPPSWPSEGREPYFGGASVIKCWWLPRNPLVC